MSTEESPVRCRATVDVLRRPPAYGGGLGVFRVHLMGVEPHDYVRTYEITAPDDNIAARRGIDRFVEEISALSREKDEAG